MIRKLQENDLDRVAKIWLDANLKAHAFLSPQYFMDHYPSIQSLFLQAELYVYEEGAVVQGFIGLEGSYIAGLFVCWEAQSRGIGRQLLDFVKGRKEQLSLRAYQKNLRAVRFYQREGFSIQCAAADQNTGEQEYLMLWKRRESQGPKKARL